MRSNTLWSRGQVNAYLTATEPPGFDLQAKSTRGYIICDAPTSLSAGPTAL